MIRNGTMIRLASAVLLATAPLALPACGDNNTTSSGPVAAFKPDTANPGAGTIAMLSGAVAGASIDVRVTVTGVTGFFGAAFRVEYDATALQFNGVTDSSSFLRVGVTNDDVLFLEDHSSEPGVVKVTATRLDPTVAPPIDVTTTADLIDLNFTARKAIAVDATEGHIDFGDPKQVCNGSVGTQGCNPVTVTWSGGGVSAQ